MHVAPDMGCPCNFTSFTTKNREHSRFRPINIETTYDFRVIVLRRTVSLSNPHPI
jgi:hypothetical protein